MNDPERSALAANAQFYRAFNQGDFSAMSALWSEQSPVACLHPGDALLVGREAVLRRWREILTIRPPFRLRCDRPTVQLFGNLAIVYCYEGTEAAPAHLAATNIFIQEGPTFRMVHHHAGPLAEPLPAYAASALN